MAIHILDLVIYFLSLIIIWKFILPKEYKYEMGILVGIFYSVIYSLIYFILFSFYYNWVDIFTSLFNFLKFLKITL
jgi:hypothetical protein